jgi:hypothetical protein
MTACETYAFFDADYRCLYVGMTANWSDRLAAHKRADWWSEVRGWSRTNHCDRNNARADELHLIATLKPIHNVRASRKPRPVRNAPVAHPDLLAEIEAHCAATGQSETAFSHLATGDMSFVADLRKGRECRFKTLRRVREYIAAAQVPA